MTLYSYSAEMGRKGDTCIKNRRERPIEGHRLAPFAALVPDDYHQRRAAGDRAGLSRRVRAAFLVSFPPVTHSGRTPDPIAHIQRKELNMSVDYSQGAPPPPPQKKGLGVLGWVAIGCGVIFLIVIILFAAGGFMAKRFIDKAGKNPEMTAAKLLIKANPDVELVKSDDDAKTFTLRDKKTGEVMTVNLSDVRNGHLTMTDGKGATVNIGGQGTEGGFNATVTDAKGQTSTMHMSAGRTANLPDWLPVYPGGSAQGTYDTTTPEGRSAMVVVTTSDTPQAVLDFYRDKLKAAGIEVNITTQEGNGGVSGGTVSGNTSDQKRSALVAVTTSEGKTQATVTFNEKH